MPNDQQTTPIPRPAGTLSVEDTLDRIKNLSPQKARAVLAVLVLNEIAPLDGFWRAMRIIGDPDDR
jgi:hypothetical protein